jgi:hypothetical protein
MRKINDHPQGSALAEVKTLLIYFSTFYSIPLLKEV